MTIFPPTHMSGEPLFVLGGDFDPGTGQLTPSDSGQTFNAQSPTLSDGTSTFTALGVPRAAFSLALLGQRLYVLGGRTRNDAPVLEVESFPRVEGANPVTNPEPFPTLPQGCIGACSVMVGKDLLLVGGTAVTGAPQVHRSNLH